MIQTPDDFEIRLDLELTDDSIVHPFIGQSLVLTADAPRLQSWACYRALGLQAQSVESVGLWQGVPHLAVRVSDREGGLPPELRSAGLRQWFGLMPETELAIAMRAVQILEWDRTHRYCGACGQSTVRMTGERARRCEACQLSTYPRISPAMMVLVTRGRQLLLGRGHHFPPGRFSALAGFLEAGETIEQAIRREVLEEVGIEVGQFRYFASQSWPFPNSLMIAFRAEWVAGDIRVDPVELAEAHWFDPEDLPQLPPHLSIARALIDATVNEIGARHR